MTSDSPDFDISAPVRTNADLLHRVDLVIDGTARRRRSLWLMFFGQDGIQSPVLVPIDDIPVRADPDGARGICHVIAQVLADAVPAGFGVVALTRPGSGAVSAPDWLWSGALREAARREGAAIRMVCLATQEGVRELAPGGSPGP